MTFGAGLFFEILGSALYESMGACAMELVRNGAVACMPDAKKWWPGVGHVELNLYDNHPLGDRGSKTFVALDHGSGFTDPAFERYYMVGPSISDLQGSGSHGGAAQKRIGRFAALALNSKCHLHKDPKSGFYVLTRTSSDGPVKFITMIPERLQLDGGPTEDELTPDAAELGPIRGIKGPFTAVVIPNSMFKTHDEIRQELEWLIPRRNMFKLLVGGAQLNPPKLARAIHIPVGDGEIEAHVEKAKVSDDPSEGIWFTDAASGLRVAFAPRLARPAKLSYPIWSSELVGDVFVRNLLPHQDSARATLTSKYLKGQDWQRKLLILHGHLLPKLRDMLGNADTFRSEKLGRMMSDLKSLFDDAFGAADANGPLVVIPGLSGGKTRLRPHIPGPRPTPTPRPPKPPNPDGGDPPKPRVFPFNFGDEVWYLMPKDLGSKTFAEADFSTGNRLFIHNGVYDPTRGLSEAAALEHMLIMLLFAVGDFKHPDDSRAAGQYVAEMRTTLHKKKGGKA